jgi:exodeoxyribonuclease-5
MTITLTPSQQQALDHLLAAVKAKASTALHGPGGTGKTFLTGVLLQRLVSQGKAVTCSAPTHKAVGVLRSKVPEGVTCCTVASLLGLRPVQRGRWIQFVADFKQAEKRGQLQGVDVLVVDEASMLSEQLGSELTKLAATTNTTVICVGDASQLPPVDPPPEPGEEGEEEDDAARGVMAQAFLAPPGGVARLTEVVRHQGPVLELATAIRECNTTAELAAVWPRKGSADDQSKVVMYDWPSQWLHSAKQVLLDDRWPAQPDTARIVCWSNKAVDRLTQEIRTAKLGAAAERGWQVGEIIANGDAIPQAGKSMAPPLAPSTCEWRVVDAEPHRLALHLHNAAWHTPKRKEPRHFSIDCDLTVQKLTLDPLVPGDRLSRITVFAPIPGSTAWSDRIKELKAEILKIEAGPTRTKAWAAWHQLRSYTADLRSASVLTVHRAQGSTFKHVWISSDLSFCTSSDALPLHYTALTRASKAVHLLRREAGR